MERCGDLLQVPPEMRGDRELVLRAVRAAGDRALGQAPMLLQCDEELIEAAADAQGRMKRRRVD
jgi:hypothetical protein